MKLINKTLLYFLMISFPLLLLAGFMSYQLIRSELREELDEALLLQKTKIEKSIAASPENLINYNPDNENGYESTSYHANATSFSDTTIYNKAEDEWLNFRTLKSYFNVNKQTYVITIRKEYIEDEELSEGLFSGFVMICVFMMLAFFLVSWFVSKKLWQPFYETLQKLNTYKVKDHSSEHFSPSSIVEFQQLNRALNQMTEKIFDDFRQQKEFTENASHEMQTPLAVIKSNLSLLMQSPQLQANEMAHLEAIENSIKKLSALNKTLLLLAKIENNQFKENSRIDLVSITNKTLVHFEDLLIAKHITIENHLSNQIIVEMNPTLAEILISNLIQNAIRHNINGGNIKLCTTNNDLQIANTGDALNINPVDLFTRFKKNNASKESLGLGLSIVKSITSVYHFEIQYDYRQSLHIFTLKF